MLSINCGACSESLIESEFFGHVRGAFTGADRDRVGKFAQCEDGTLLLDEVDALSPAAQVKLLHVVEDKVFQPVGSTAMLPVRARLIVASNRDLESEVEAGRFRSDLFYRLNIMSFRLLPLRERRHEIPRLVDQFVQTFAAHHGFRPAPLTDEASAALTDYCWPGNIRELRNVIERAVILSSGKPIVPADLPPQVAEAVSRADSCLATVTSLDNKLAQARGQAERDQLLDALERNQHNRTQTAMYLGISRVALYKRLRKFQLL